MYDPSFTTFTIALKIKTKNNIQGEGLWQRKKFYVDKIVFSAHPHSSTPEKVSPRGEFLREMNKKLTFFFGFSPSPPFP